MVGASGPRAFEHRPGINAEALAEVRMKAALAASVVASMSRGLDSRQGRLGRPCRELRQSLGIDAGAILVSPANRLHLAPPPPT